MPGSATTHDVRPSEALTAKAVHDLAVRWYQALDRHEDVESVLGFLVDDGLELRFPEGVSRGHSGFRDWYSGVTRRFFDETHTLREVTITSTVAEGVDVSVIVNWQAKIWNPPAAQSEWLGFDAYQTWRVVGPGDRPQIQRYVVDELRPMPGSASLAPAPEPGVVGGEETERMSTAEVVNRYFELASAGDWDRWCDLFAADQVMDEQLAGRVEGLETLRAMMAGFPQAYPRFVNALKHVVVNGEEAATTSHISAQTATGATIEADAANYFRVADGHIAYMANFHDSVPFTRALGQ